MLSSLLDVDANPDLLHYAHADHLASVQLLVDGTGAIEESYRYDAWGVPTVVDSSFTKLSAGSTSQVGNVYMYTGRAYAPASAAPGEDWYYYRARHYRADAGRFVQRMINARSMSSNLYVGDGMSGRRQSENTYGESGGGETPFCMVEFATCREVSPNHAEACAKFTVKDADVVFHDTLCNAVACVECDTPGEIVPIAYCCNLDCVGGKVTGSSEGGQPTGTYVQSTGPGDGGSSGENCAEPTGYSGGLTGPWHKNPATITPTSSLWSTAGAVVIAAATGGMTAAAGVAAQAGWKHITNGDEYCCDL